MTGRYDSRAFAQAYLFAQASEEDGVGDYLLTEPAYNAALREHHKRVLAGLEKLFGVTLDVRSTTGDTALLWLFTKTARSCHSPRTPLSGFLEAGLLIRRLAEGGDAGTRVLATFERIGQLRDAWHEAHLDVLDDLLGMLLGERADRVFTSADLRAAGVDDTPPELTDHPSDPDVL
jgi:hypothetical protein